MTLLEKLNELSQQATPGPWEVNPDGAEEWWYSDTILGESGAGGALASCTGDNAALIVTAINALPALLEVAGAARELLEVAKLRGDNELQHPADDPKLWTARMQDAWDTADAALAKLEVEK